MSETETDEPRIEDLRILLEEKGAALSGEAPSVSIPSLGRVPLWRVTRYCGFQTELEDCGVGRLVVREVEALPDTYTQSDPELLADFEERRYSGILADSSWFLLGHTCLSVGRSSILETTGQENGKMSYRNHNVKQVGEHPGVNSLMRLSLPENDGVIPATRLGSDAVDYSEPSTPQMILSGLGRTLL